MTGKTVLITGANQGIGKAAAVALGRQGAKLVLVCRSAARAREAVAEIEREGARDVELILGDLGSQADVRRIAADFQAKHQRLDVLLNNAGLLVTKRRTTVDGIEETFAVNHLGYFLLTNLLLDVLRASPGARIVSVSSDAHRRGTIRWDDLQFEKEKYNAWGAYSQSKLANILFTRALSRRLHGTRLTANCLHPGVVATGFGHTYGGFARVLATIARPFLIKADEGAKTSVYLASSPEVEGVSGEYFAACRVTKPSAAAREAGAAERLWAISESMTGLASAAAA